MDWIIEKLLILNKSEWSLFILDTFYIWIIIIMIAFFLLPTRM